MSYEHIIVPLPKKRKTPLRTEVKRKMFLPRQKLATFGQQCRMIRETRKITKEKLCRMMGVGPRVIYNIERYNGFNVSIEVLNLYMKAIGATMVVIPTPVPSYIDTFVESVELSVKKVRTKVSNLHTPDLDDDDED